MKQYLDVLADIYENGDGQDDRTGTGTRALFGPQYRVDLNKGFPLLTTKKIFVKGVIHELLWLISGSTNIKYLVENGVRIWNDWPLRHYLLETTHELDGLAVGSKEYTDKMKEHMSDFVQRIVSDDAFAERWGELGPVYGKQWRAWEKPDGTTIDQLAEAIEQIKNNPSSRRIIVSAWNASDIKEMAKSGLPPCHTLYQFHVSRDGRLSCKLYQRSADMFLGVPFNLASYALLTMMVAQVCDLELGDFVHTFGDAHIYNNHVDQVNEQMSRETRALPRMVINPDVKNIDDFVFGDFDLQGYDPHPPISAPVAV